MLPRRADATGPKSLTGHPRRRIRSKRVAPRNRSCGNGPGGVRMTRTVVTVHERPDNAAEMIDTLQALLEIERERSDSMKQALRAARRTGMAVGMVMARHGIDDDQAFARLH